MSEWWGKLRELVAKQSIAEALEEAGRLASSDRELCVSSSEFLALSARVCASSRQWWLSGLLARKAVKIDNFDTQQSKDWSLSLLSFSEGYNMVMRGLLTESALNKILEILDSAGLVGIDLQRKLLILLSSYMRLEHFLRERVLRKLREVHEAPSGGLRDDSLGALVKLERIDDPNEWVPQVDAGEIGNESRYANHADLPNAILAKRCYSNCESRVCGKCVQYPHLVALRDIAPDDEVTINYGSSYWTKIRPGSDPLLLGQIVPGPFADCVYFNGVVTDFACSPIPGGFLLNPLEIEQRAKRLSHLKVKRVPEDHPAYPGFGLFATHPMPRGAIICVYAGIVDVSPLSGRHQSKYTVDLTGEHGIGAFGFSFDPITLEIVPEQKYMPFLTEFDDISIPRRAAELDLLAGVSKIASLDEQLTRTICDALMMPAFRPAVQQRLRALKAPFDNGSKKDASDWSRAVKRAFSDIFEKPPPPTVPFKRTRTPEPPELVELD